MSIASSLLLQRLNQAAKSSSNSAGAGAGPGASSAANKLEILKEEEEEVKRKVEQCKVRTSLALLLGAAPGLETCFSPAAPSKVTPSPRASRPAQPILRKQPAPFQQCGSREIPQAWGRTKVKDLKHKLLQRGGSRGWSRENKECSQV